MWHEARFAAQALHHRSTKIAALLLLQTLACGVVCCLASQPADYYSLSECSASVTAGGAPTEDITASFCANVSVFMRDDLDREDPPGAEPVTAKPNRREARRARRSGGKTRDA